MMKLFEKFVKNFANKQIVTNYVYELKEISKAINKNQVESESCNSFSYLNVELEIIMEE